MYTHTCDPAQDDFLVPTKAAGVEVGVEEGDGGGGGGGGEETQTKKSKKHRHKKEGAEGEHKKKKHRSHKSSQHRVLDQDAEPQAAYQLI